MTEPKFHNAIMMKQMMPSLPFVLGRSKTLAFTFILIGGLCSFLQIWLALLGVVNLPMLFTGLLTLVNGIGYLTSPVAIFHSNEIILQGYFGIQGKVYEFPSFDTLKLERNTLYISDGTKHRKVAIAAWMVNRKHWRQLKALIRASEGIAL